MILDLMSHVTIITRMATYNGGKKVLDKRQILRESSIS